MVFANRLAASWIWLIVLFDLAISTTNCASKPCNVRVVANGQVCVCNATYCDTLEDRLIPISPDEVIVVSTSPTGAPFNVTYTQFDKCHPQINIYNGTDNIEKAKITVNQCTEYQTIIGFGGAHTGSVTYLLQQLPQSLQDHIYESYYSSTKGIGYTITRVPIGGSDCDFGPWAYNESPVDDKKLSNFTTLDTRDLDRIDQFRRLMLVTDQYDIKFLGAAWSAPPWMKSNNDWDGPSELLPQYYDTWAEYHVRYLELMKYAGIDYWAISTGNEPLDGSPLATFIPYMTLGWTTEAQAKFLTENLGPKLSCSVVSNVKILAGDDQRYTYPWWFQEINETYPNAMDYLYGFAVHYYADTISPPSSLDETKRQFPSKVIINTESCEGSKSGEVRGPLLGSFHRSVNYILSYMQDLSHSVSGWIDWNLILDPIGGPNYVQNYVDSPIITNATAGEIYKQPIFYAIGHFSRFITEGSIRIEVTTSNELIKTLGFKRPDGNVVLILFNQFLVPIDLYIVDGSRIVLLTIPPETIQTVVYRSLN